MYALEDRVLSEFGGGRLMWLPNLERLVTEDIGSQKFGEIFDWWEMEQQKDNQ